MNYNFNEIEAKWQKYWAEHQTFKAENNSGKEKFYVLDMFPYPSGAGLHVGHPLGYIASDIYARYKRHKGFNVLHPQGYDSFGLPAEQYAIQTGQHPAITTEENIKTYRRQLDQLGFSFDWSREVRTSDPKYYKWTQWIFIQLFNSWYNKDTDKAEDIETLMSRFAAEGNTKVNAACDEDVSQFSADDWNSFSSKEQQEILLKYRLTYLADTEVNWVPALGTVLANDEIVNGVSERGGHPVVRKKMTQWSMRITAYAQRLLDGLNTIDWPQPLKDSQTNWIGRSEGASVNFKVLPLAPSEGGGITPRYITADSDLYPVLLERAKEMRKNPTAAEDKLWQALRRKNLDVRFRRQHPIYRFIVDFVCLEKGLIIEVDGKIHEYQLDNDAQRTLELEQKKGYTVIRFDNDEVLNDLERVVSEIEDVLNSLPLGEGWGGDFEIEVFTTRPDTIFGASFMTLAPEHELVPKITTPEQKAEVEAYIEATAKRSERDRMADVKTVSGTFTGAYAEHPFTKEPVPIWIGDYVLAGYGTGAVMSVPCGDQRDYDFAKHFGIPIPNIFEGIDISEEAFADKEKTIIANSDFLNGLSYKEAVKKVIAELEKIGQGKGKVNYRLRDAVFSRQRYWGEPFPVYYDEEGMPQMLDEKFLPLELPEVDKYLPTETGDPPLGNAKKWHWLQYGGDGKVVSKEEFENSSPEGRLGGPLELNTMPGWAGSSQYFNRYMDPHNDKEIFSREAIDYWQDVDLYIGGSEHATGHLLYSRFWQKFMFDKGLVPKAEFAKKLINQGMITGTSAFVYRMQQDTMLKDGIDVLKALDIKRKEYFLSKSLNDDYIGGVYNPILEKVKSQIIEDYKKVGVEAQWFEEVHPTSNPIHADVSFVNASDELDIEAFKNWRPEYKDAIFILENGELYDSNSLPLGEGRGGVFRVSREIEKMSKSKYNVVNPDDICEEYGADSLRMYEMFLGPLEQSKPWNTAGITGVHSFLKKLWRLYHSGPNGEFHVTDSPPSGEPEGAKTLHKTIKKVEDDIENFSFNTSVSTFMICVNELTAQKCHSREILEPLAILVSPYAPHIAEELWGKLGHGESIAFAPFPKFEEKYLVESTKEYPISFNGKMRFTMELPLDLSKEEIEAAVMANEKTQQQLQGRTPKKVIVVPGKIVNIVG
ncbi:leucine--tRNA ligase [Maribacter algicola]|uniref:Leucine--tRNA ligase n=1 Tax=Meishania litoralis TaxID=3434685 RepID=A0ACC7LJI7_9FLAO